MGRSTLWDGTKGTKRANPTIYTLNKRAKEKKNLSRLESGVVSDILGAEGQQVCVSVEFHANGRTWRSVRGVPFSCDIDRSMKFNSFNFFRASLQAVEF